MGAVLLARDPAIDRQVAVKLIQTSVQLTPAEWEKYKERFYREARAAGKLLHQGIVAIFDVGHTVEGIPFIVMEYVEGRTLAAFAEDNGAAARRGPAPGRAVPRGARVRPRPGCHSPGPEAREHHDHRRWASQDHGLRRGARRRLADDPGRRDPRQPPLHGSRAARQGKGRPAHRPVRLRRRALLDADRPPPVHGRFLRRHRSGDPVGKPRLAEGAQADDSASPRPDRAALPGEEPGQAVRDRARAAGGAPRGRKARASPVAGDRGTRPPARDARLALPLPQVARRDRCRMPPEPDVVAIEHRPGGAS